MYPSPERLFAVTVLLVGSLIFRIDAAHATGWLDSGVAFHYGRHVPIDELALFSLVVLDPERAESEEVRATVSALAVRGGLAVARMACAFPVDRAQVQERARAVRNAGFAGALLAPEGQGSSADLTSCVRVVRDVWPQGPVLLEADPGVAASIPGLTALVAGPLFSRWDAVSHGYVAIDENTRTARTAALRAFTASGGVPAIVVEAAPSSARGNYCALARKVAGLGFVPWIAPASREQVGCGLIEPVPRRILVVIDGAEEPFLPSTVAHRLVAVPLEHLGFAVDYADIRVGLPSGSLADRYAGIVTWFTDDEMGGPRGYEAWLGRQIDDGVRIAVLGHLGFGASESFLKRLGIENVADSVKPPLRLEAADGVIGFEAPPTPRARELRPWTSSTLTRHLDLIDAAGRRISPVMEGTWGGVALDPYLTVSGFEGRLKWIVDPFRFLASALHLPAIPAPDPTTENGRRLLEIHVDGDGFPSRSELGDHAFAGEVIRREFLVRYRLPVTVSVIEGEIGLSGLHPADSPTLEGIARAIFALPNVEIASHSYSHPFDWLRAGRTPGSSDDPETEETAEGDRLRIPGYEYSVEREVDGSVRYIDSRLAPPGKTTRVFLWSGTAQPPAEAIERSEALGLENVNGDNAEEPTVSPTLAQVPSFTRPVDGHLQIYAAGQNENVFTNLWHGPFYGYRHVIDYFRFTESPRRLKPIAIYYHFYSGTKAAAVKALHDVYDWAAAEETFPVWTSEYAARVRGFDRATLARRLNGDWLLVGFGVLRTIRLPAELGWPDLAQSQGVFGVRDLPQGRYVALGGDAVTTLATRPEAPSGPFLEAANGSVLDWRPDGDTVHLRVHGHVPVELTIGGCPSLRVTGATSFVRSAEGRVTSRGLRFPTEDTGEVDVACR